MRKHSPCHSHQSQTNPQKCVNIKYTKERTSKKTRKADKIPVRKEEETARTPTCMETPTAPQEKEVKNTKKRFYRKEKVLYTLLAETWCLEPNLASISGQSMLPFSYSSLVPSNSPHDTTNAIAKPRLKKPKKQTLVPFQHLPPFSNVQAKRI